MHPDTQPTQSNVDADAARETDTERYERELREYEAKVEKAAAAIFYSDYSNASWLNAFKGNWLKYARAALKSQGINRPEKPDGAKRIAEWFIQQNRKRNSIFLANVTFNRDCEGQDLEWLVRTLREHLADAIRKYGDERYEEGRRSTNK